jgi:uncharacterized protein YqjF (DUF2071 family)
MSFLKAEWRKLALANYIIEPEVLQEFVPSGTALDLWEGKCYVSLVGFMFVNTKVLGLKIPWHVNFEEVNLRFYVKYEEEGTVKRGVVFIKEIVPRSAITFVANTLYREHYQTLKMRHEWRQEESSRLFGYSWKTGKKWNRFEVTTELNSIEMEEDSETEFITEHYWGYSRQGANKTFEYEVTHPKWNHYPVTEHKIDVDYAKTYGKQFGFLNDRTPDSVMLAEGSEITVEGKRRID